MPDPYRWLEDGDSPEVGEWVAAQNARTRGALDACPDRKAWLDRLVTLLELPVSTGVRVAADRVFSLERGGGQKQFTLVVRPAGEAAGRARVLVDPATLVADATAAIDWYHPSLDGELVAYGVSEGGDERSVLRVLEVSTGQHRADEIPDTRAASVAWLPGNHSFFYARYPADDEYNRRIFRHRLGRPWTEDELVWGDLPTPETWADVTTSPDGRFTLVTAMVGWSRTDLHLRHEATGEWRTLISGVDVTTQARFDGDRLVAVTTLDALRGRVVGIPLEGCGGGVGVGDAGTRRRRCRAARRAGGRWPVGGHDDGLHGTRRAARIGRRAGGRARAPRAVLGGGPRSVTGWRDRLFAAGGLHPSRQPLPVGRW